MTTLTIAISDDEVDAVTLRRMSSGEWIATATHRFGFAYDAHGQILNPAPYGVGTSTSSAEAAWEKALADLRNEVAKKITQNNALPSNVGKYPALTRTSVSLDLDLEL